MVKKRFFFFLNLTVIVTGYVPNLRDQQILIKNKKSKTRPVVVAIDI